MPRLIKEASIEARGDPEAIEEAKTVLPTVGQRLQFARLADTEGAVIWCSDNAPMPLNRYVAAPVTRAPPPALALVVVGILIGTIVGVLAIRGIAF